MGVTSAYEPSSVGLKPGPQQAAELGVCQVEDSGSQFYGAGDDCQTVNHLSVGDFRGLSHAWGLPILCCLSSSVLCYTLYRWLLYLHPTWNYFSSEFKAYVGFGV